MLHSHTFPILDEHLTKREQNAWIFVNYRSIYRYTLHSKLH